VTRSLFLRLRFALLLLTLQNKNEQKETKENHTIVTTAETEKKNKDENNDNNNSSKTNKPVVVEEKKEDDDDEDAEEEVNEFTMKEEWKEKKYIQSLTEAIAKNSYVIIKNVIPSEKADEVRSFFLFSFFPLWCWVVHFFSFSFFCFFLFVFSFLNQVKQLVESLCEQEAPAGQPINKAQRVGRILTKHKIFRDLMSHPLAVALCDAYIGSLSLPFSRSFLVAFSFCSLPFFPSSFSFSFFLLLQVRIRPVPSARPTPSSLATT
jgi:hypothetical protein